MNRILAFLYGLIAYIVFLVSFLYAVGFVGNLIVPKSIDSGEAGPIGTTLLMDALLLGIFAIQHSVMARQGFKRWWTRIVPKPVERSTYVLIASLLLLLLFWKWEPMPGEIWSVENATGRLVLQGLFWIGWFVVLVSTYMIDHFDLFGLRQVTLYLRGRECTPPSFKTAGFYKAVRHPIMLGFLIAFWATPVMTLGHLVFSIATTGYILVGICLEERDLLRLVGEKYQTYRKQVPMLIPFLKR